MSTEVAGRIRNVYAAAYKIPTDHPEADGTAAWESTTLILVTVQAAGMTGVGWTYGERTCAGVVTDVLGPAIVGHDPMDVPRIWTTMVRSVRNATRTGVAGYAISAVDVACWDLKARLLGVSMVDLFGAAADRVPVYGSGGFTTYTDALMRDQLSYWVDELAIPRAKIKIGEDAGTRVDRDLARIRTAREAIGPAAELFVDANGAYGAKQAIRVMHACADADVKWLEEPVSSDDLAGLFLVRTNVDADVAAGEYGGDVTYFQRMCDAQAVDCLQIDATRCGGFTEWIRACAVAAAHHLSVSGHCAPNLHAHVAAATPNLRHIELFHDHDRIEQLAFDGALDADGGAMTPDRSSPGHGLTVRGEALERYRVK